MLNTFSPRGRTIKMLVLILAAASLSALFSTTQAADRRPNILIAISDDQSFRHTSVGGFEAVRTPAFDRIAKEGVLFRNAIGASPGCSPCRAALLTGRHTWQIEQAGTHASSFPTNYVTFPDLLELSGYYIGHTGKGWGPGNWETSGRTRNPAGPAFNRHKLSPPFKGLSNNDYAGNFSEFLEKRPKDTPFYFWYGAAEPHRVYEKGVGQKSGRKLSEVEVPPFLPDTPEIRADILDYCAEIEWFDEHLKRMLSTLENAGELDNTLIMVTSDNGMPFPRAKANCYEYGIHMPLAIRWGNKAPGGRAVDDVVGFVDLTATILEVAEVEPPRQNKISGRSLLNVLISEKQGIVDPSRTVAFAARERHSSSRYNNWTYPQRALRTPQYLYIRNFKPDRWPAGDPRMIEADGKPGPMHSAYCDIDGSPSLTFLVKNHGDPRIQNYLELAVDKRPAEELFDIIQDPGCLTNLIGQPAFARIGQELSQQLLNYLRHTNDPRVTGNGDIWESYPRYSPIRTFPAPSATE